MGNLIYHITRKGDMTMGRVFNAEFVKIKKQIVSVYCAITELQDNLSRVKVSQKKELDEATTHLKLKMDALHEEIFEMREEAVETLKAISKGIRGFGLVRKIQKLNSLDDDLDTCYLAYTNLIDEVNKKNWGN